MPDTIPSVLSNGDNSIIVPSNQQQLVLMTGAVLPEDMRIKLIRADSSSFDTILTVFFSITLTLFGTFLGIWITDSVKTSSSEKVATVAFGGLSLALIIWWIVIKVTQMKKGVTVPISVLNSISGN